MSSILLILSLYLVAVSALPKKLQCIQTKGEKTGENCCIRKNECGCGVFNCGTPRRQGNDFGSHSESYAKSQDEHSEDKEENQEEDLYDLWDPALFETGLEE
ncbi:DgyrCDS8639 [Dimorphilus gyrociliatus]|uniref:DgyrCDS8639 n=1 Tax=Dimorphilus gyrociliatus TaxID=2664684 RepID=A0A7I8VVS6_9ANNE|nr:DgyrCDS8639 [Dimorphilus gyrociliatus]